MYLSIKSKNKISLCKCNRYHIKIHKYFLLINLFCVAQESTMTSLLTFINLKITDIPDFFHQLKKFCLVSRTIIALFLSSFDTC